MPDNEYSAVETAADEQRDPIELLQIALIQRLNEAADNDCR